MNEANRDRERWTARYASADRQERAASSWVLAACARIPIAHTILDLAAGTGRHAVPLARAGRNVIALDFVESAVQRAAQAHALVHGVVADVWSLPLPAASVHALLVTNFLERALFEDVKALIAPGGFLVYETYTVDHRQLVEAGRARAPSSAAYLLEAGELPRLIAPLEVLEQREGYVNDAAGERFCASVLAKKSGN